MSTSAPVERVSASRWPRWGLIAAVTLMALTVAVPLLTGWDVNARVDDKGPFPPLHGFFDAKVGIGTVPAILIALLAFRYAAPLAATLSWRHLMLASYVAGAAWLLALAFVDGPSGIDRVLGNPFEYLGTAREIDNIPLMLETYVDRIPYSATDNWVTHIAGHPPGAVLFFIGLVKVGLGGDFVAGIVVTLIAATTALAVMSTLRTLGSESLARLAAPFLVFTPAAVFMAVSADAMFAAVAAWGLAALAVAATRTSTIRMVAWSLVAGLLLGYCVMLSYGLPLLGLLAVTVLFLAKQWRPLPVAVLGALIVVGGFAAYGFYWWEAYPVLVDRYWDGVAAVRPQAYWFFGDIGALLFSAGPLLGAGLAYAIGDRRRLVSVERVALFLAGAAALSVLIADLSRMSKSEVERIWLPFIPWMTLSLALLPEFWRRWGLAVQLGFALLVQHLLYTSW
ncbi:hypothetical protein GCM10027020_22420 [Nocardioides salsibiostraticola]